MKWTFDFTSQKDDMVPLTPEERKAFLKTCGVLVIILIAGSMIIIGMLCR